MTATLLKTQEVADRLRIAPETARKWIWMKKIPVVKLGRAVRVREEDLEALIDMGYIAARR